MVESVSSSSKSDSGKSSKKSSGPKLTPMMERYLEVKQENPGTLLLFRMGDFYELFYEDAEIAAKTLGITLTSRDKGSANPIAMAGFPYHSLDGYLQKLIRAGHRAAICEQVEDPKQAKGLVKREVTRVVTPGTLTEDNLLDPRTSNYLAAVSVHKELCGLSWLELSTGRFQISEFSRSELWEELGRIQPTELIVSDDEAGEELGRELSEPFPELTLTPRAPWLFVSDSCKERLNSHFGTHSLDGFQVEPNALGIIPAGVLLDYVQETQRTAISHITKLECYGCDQQVRIDEATRRSLELTQTLRSGEKQGSLLHILDKTVTPMGARLLAEWISTPLIDINDIDARASSVEEMTKDSALLRAVREQLEGVYDLQRLSARVATGRCSPRDLVWLARTLSRLPKLKAQLVGRTAPKLQELESEIDLCEEARTAIESCLVDEPPLNISDGDGIREGFDEQLDELRLLSRGGKEWIAAYQKTQIERTGITNLKVGFNKVFGYYLEVTASQRDRVPDDFIRKQTLKNQERYITPELKEHEEKVLSADQRSLARELELFQELRDKTLEYLSRIQSTAQALAELDVLACFAHVAVQNRYCRPEMTDAPVLDIREGRHPVLDAILPSGEYVPNDVLLGPIEEETATEKGLVRDSVQLITGPNMAGKSTYIRQAALITLMAQTGSFVPASEARIGVVDRIYARVGASDELSRGQSTFMVEMTETARILNGATARSLVILDEIGRGTSTYDGLSLAWAITEYLHDVVGARTFFATHYHELTVLEDQLAGVKNWNVAVHESNGEVHFLHRIVRGAADRSYGIHVARLAGVPREVIQRAGQLLDVLEQQQAGSSGGRKIPRRETAGQKQLQLFDPPPHPVVEQLQKINLDDLTPKQALDRLYELRGALSSTK